MVCNLNTTNLAQVDGGCLIKQGDVASIFGFVLSDKELVTEEIHSLKELDIAEEVKKQLAGRTVGGDSTVSQEFPDLLFYYNLGKV